MDPDQVDALLQAAESELCELRDAMDDITVLADERIRQVKQERDRELSALQIRASAIESFVAGTRGLMHVMGVGAEESGSPTVRNVPDVEVVGPRGVEAVRQILVERPSEAMSVSEIASEIEERGWVDLKSRGNLANATRTNLLRAVERYEDINRVRRGVYIYLPDPVSLLQGHEDGSDSKNAGSPIETGDPDGSELPLERRTTPWSWS